jgi:hypothetical protein
MLPEESGTESAVEAPKDDYVLHSETVEAEKSAAEQPEQVEAPETEQSEESEQTETTERKPKRGGFQKKLERQSAQIAELQAELDRMRSGPKQDSSSVSDGAPVKPKADDFNTYAEYEDAKDDYYEKLADWKAEQKVSKAFESQNKRSQEQAQQKDLEDRITNYRKQVEDARKVHADFDEVINSYDGELTPHMQAALLDSEMGAEVSYYLAKHPEEAEKLEGMGLIQINKAIAKIEAKLEMKSQKSVVKTSNSPPPINPVTKGTTKSTKSPDEMDMDEYNAWRDSQRRVRR